MRTYWLAPVDKDDKARSALVATRSTIMMTTAPATQGGDEVRPAPMAAIPTTMVLLVPLALLKTNPAPRGSLWVLPHN